MSILSSALNSHRAWARAVVVCTLAAVLGGLPMVVAPPAEAAVPVPDSWETVALMSTARFGLAVTRGVAPDNRIYALGGGPKNGPPPTYDFTDSAVDIAEAYDPDARTWTALPPMTVARETHAAATDRYGRIYAIGGTSAVALSSLDEPAASSVEAYNPDTNAWDLVAPLHNPRMRLAAVAGPDGRIYAMGGRPPRTTAVGSLTVSGIALPAPADLGVPSPADAISNTVEAYDPAQPLLGWVAVAPMIHPRVGFGAAVSGGRIYAVGGEGAAGASVEAYDPANPSAGWVEVAPMPLVRRYHAAATGPDGRIYAIGGVTDNVSDA